LALVASLVLGLVALAGLPEPPEAAAHAINGAIYTTDGSGNPPTNGNIYKFKADVYLSGGPKATAGCSGGALEAGDYYFQVTDPSGTVLLSAAGGQPNAGADLIADRKFTVNNTG
jgi:hypothetical protein